jgi:hypothetical protein
VRHAGGLRARDADPCSQHLQNLTLAAVRFDLVIGGMWWMQKLTRSAFA